MTTSRQRLRRSTTAAFATLALGSAALANTAAPAEADEPMCEHFNQDAKPRERSTTGAEIEVKNGIVYKNGKAYRRYDRYRCETPHSPGFAWFDTRYEEIPDMGDGGGTGPGGPHDPRRT
jgi:hypothetical protein